MRWVGFELREYSLDIYSGMLMLSTLGLQLRQALFQMLPGTVFPKQIVWTALDQSQNSFPCEPARKPGRSAMRWDRRVKEFAKRNSPTCD